ncbi:MAG TPA: c-type cytochrome biogenesis protein CcmI [Rhodobacteraceae bacterium]|nr:c-type cytochrome biogenesis protein CcmI [Paracoccaceae bacterium]
MWFWIIASLIIMVVALFFVLALLRAKDSGPVAAEFDLQVYRDQLKTTERDLERGVVSIDDSIRIKTEISRRILAADKALKEQTDAKRAPVLVTFGVMALTAATLLASFWVYGTIGAPGYPDLPLQLRIEQAREIKANRPRQAQAEAQTPAQNRQVSPKHQELVERLRESVAKKPNDLKGQTLLAGNEAALGNFTAAYRAHSKLIQLKGTKASAKDYADLANLMIMAAGGFVSPEAETALKQSLQRDPQHGTALYYTGLMYAQSGRPDVAFGIWRDLLKTSKASDPWVRPIRSQIQQAASWAGVNYKLPELEGDSTPAGPTAEDIAAATQMSEQDRQEMVRNMVAQLSGRLADEGGSAQEWARLIRAVGVLGDKERAGKIWTEAQSVFSGKENELEILRAAARSAGVAQ